MKYILLDEKYSFSQEVISKASALKDVDKKAKDKTQVKEALKQLNTEYKSLVKTLKVDVKNNILQVKEKYKALEENVHKEHEEALKELNAQSLEKKKYKDLLSGINIKEKRAIKDLTKERLQDEIDCKHDFIEVRKNYADLHAQIVGKNSIWFNTVTEHIEETNATCWEKRLRDRDFWISKISIFSFIVLLLIYIIICLAAGSKIEYEKILKASSVIIAVSLGGVFIYSMRSFDMSLGAGTCVAAALGGLVWGQTKSIVLVLLVGIIVGVVIELINSALASVLKLPVMVTTLAMATVLGSVMDSILDMVGTETISIRGTRAYNNFGFIFTLLIIFFLICAFLFKFTPIGRKNKMIGANSTSSRYSGINIMKQGLITFTIAGCAIGVGATLYMVQSSAIAENTCSTLGLDVILAIVFGGMQTTGGPKSKISAAITGGLSATLITYILIALTILTGNKDITAYESLFKGALFLVIVTANTIGSRTKRLPAIEMLW